MIPGNSENSTSGIVIRLANYTDARQLGALHHVCSSVQPGGFMHMLGRRFFVTYYKILLKEPSCVAVCADKDKVGIVGLAVASLDVKKERCALRRNRFRLLLGALPSLLRHPSLIRGVLLREKLLMPNSSNGGMIVNAGARASYWGWSPAFKDGDRGASIKMLRVLFNILRSLGVSILRLEVDSLNQKVEFTHRMMGAKVVQEFTTFDGRLRRIMEHRLK